MLMVLLALALRLMKRLKANICICPLSPSLACPPDFRQQSLAPIAKDDARRLHRVIFPSITTTWKELCLEMASFHARNKKLEESDLQLAEPSLRPRTILESERTATGQNS
jgi:hypothetical protein